MPDLRTQLRWYYESLIRPRDPAEVIAGRVGAVRVGQGLPVREARRWWQQPAAIAVGAATAVLVLIGGTALLTLHFSRGGPAEPTVPVTPTVTTTTALATTAAATVEAAPSSEGLEALAAYRAGPPPAAATCPAGSTPDTAGDPSAPRPFGVPYAVAFDRESGRLLATFSGHTMWAFDPCLNRWTEGGSEGSGASAWMVYDADSDLAVLVGPRGDASDAGDAAGVWSYDLDTDTWAQKGAPPRAVDTASPLVYHDPSGLVLARGDSGETIWGYDVESDAWHELGALGPGLLVYSPVADGFYLHRAGDDPPGWWYAPGQGWTRLAIPDAEAPVLALARASSRIAFDPATGQIIAFSGYGNGVVTALDPATTRWEVLDGASDGAAAAVVYDSANSRLIVLSGGEGSEAGWVAGQLLTEVRAFDARTLEWTLLLPEAAAGIVPLDGEPDEFYATSLAAVSAGEAWAAGGDLIGHLEEGAWSWYRLTAQGYVIRLAVAGDATVWVASDLGAFSFDGTAWTRRYEQPASGVAAGPGGEVWIGGWATCSPWVAQWQGGSWAVDQPVVDCACSGSGWGLPLAVSTDGDVWVPQQLCWGWGLMRYDGTAWEEIEIEGADQWVIEAGPAGEVWVLGMGARDSGQRPFARFDGEARTIYDWPFATSLRSMAVGPDGTVWIIYGTSLRSFDGTDWTTHVEGTEMSSIDVAPDGTVWYADEEGVHTLED